jgi:DNA gyrase subunit A
VPADQVRLTARATMGVTLLRLEGEERVTSVFAVVEDEAAEDAPPDDGPEPMPPVIGDGDGSDG